ncbi:hypothetical protein [Streptomyces sp. NPDC101166]|uniref:hypothetical protein n=1 Tax=Streptomyces sp. NPDC101166 TaxID=3366120 RepID=UPI003811854C
MTPTSSRTKESAQVPVSSDSAVTGKTTSFAMAGSSSPGTCSTMGASRAVVASLPVSSART